VNLILTSLLLGNFIVTAYRSVPEQTDSSPFYTSIGEHVHPYGVAVSRNLLKRWGGPLNYGDFIYIEGIGFKVVNDNMNARHTNRVDVWVETYQAEKRHDDEFRNKKLRVWLIKHPTTLARLKLKDWSN